MPVGVYAAVSGSARQRVRLLLDPELPPTPVPSSITVEPAPFNVTIGGTAQLSATVNDQFGAVYFGATLDWSSSDTGVATVSSGGLVTGVGAGACAITVAVVGYASTTTQAACTVSAPAVATLDVAPASLALTVGGATGALTFTPRDAGGNALSGRTVTGTSNATGTATISLSGYAGTVTPVAAGTTTVYGTCEGINSATVSVTNVAGGVDYPNEPAGFTQVAHRVFSSSTEDGWSAQTGGTLKTDGTGLPTGLATYIQHSVPSNGTVAGSYSMGITDKVISGLNKTRLYASVWFKISSTFQGQSTNTNKLALWLPAGSTGNSFFLNLKGNGLNTLRAEAYFQGIPTGLNGGANSRRITASAGFQQQTVTRDVWHQWELDYTLNTYDVADGVLKMWFNGVQFIHETNIGTRGTGGDANQPFWRVKWNPYWGGGPAVPPVYCTNTTQILCAEIYVSG